jgi:ubiquitin carboxyl-terminal hydrolase L3
MGKYFVPLESNPEVFNELIYSLGVSNELGFHDVYVIDDPDMLAMIPRPVYALLMVFPVSDSYEDYRKQNDKDLEDDYYNAISGTPQEDALWYKQTIGNACGTYALLHALSNGVPENTIAANSPLQRLQEATKHLNVVQRAQYFESSDELEKLHASVAERGDTEAPPAEEQTELHYVCLTKAKGSGDLYELDGRRKGPIRIASLAKDEDLLGPHALQRVTEFLQREGTSATFSIIALAKNWS